MKVLITGGAGFIGSHLTDRFLEEGHSVICIDNFLLGRKEFLSNAMKNNKFKLEEMDLLDLEKLDLIFSEAEIDLVCHLAANSDIREGTKSTNRDLNLTFMTTYNILECMRRHSVRKLIFTSTPAIFGPHESALSEDLPMRPISLYGASKLASEAYIRAFSHLYDINVWIFRLSNMVGERMTHGIIVDFIEKLKNNRNFLEVLGDGRQCKPYMYVKDLIDCILFVFKSTTDKVNIYNVGPKDCILVSLIAELVLEHFGHGQVIRYLGGSGGWKGDVPMYKHDSLRLRNLGWEPSFSSEEAIRHTLQKIRND